MGGYILEDGTKLQADDYIEHLETRVEALAGERDDYFSQLFGDHCHRCEGTGWVERHNPASATPDDPDGASDHECPDCAGTGTTGGAKRELESAETRLREAAELLGDDGADAETLAEVRALLATDPNENLGETPRSVELAKEERSDDKPSCCRRLREVEEAQRDDLLRDLLADSGTCPCCRQGYRSGEPIQMLKLSFHTGCLAALATEGDE